jgi:hypothetical protein
VAGVAMRPGGDNAEVIGNKDYVTVATELRLCEKREQEANSLEGS